MESLPLRSRCFLVSQGPCLGGGGSLFQGLLEQWPTFFAFVTSFMTILIMWVGHHEMFTYVMRTDRRFVFLNGLLLFFVTLTPFTTSPAADQFFPVMLALPPLSAGNFLLLAIAWNVL
jgi:uncharacterized membrane protein